MVLADDRFVTIGEAVEGGRVVFDNIRKFVFYLFSCNIAEVAVLFAADMAGVAGMLTPLQILWMNLVTDTFPALALAVEPGDSSVMRRPPRDPGKAILSAAFLRGSCSTPSSSPVSQSQGSSFWAKATRPEVERRRS